MKMTTNKPPNDKSTAKNHLTVMSVFAAVFTVSVIFTCLFYKPSSFTPDPKMDKMIEFINSEKFSQLPEKEQREYMRAMRPKPGSSPNSSGMSREQHAAVRKVMQKQMQEKIKKFFAMSKEEQEKYLDAEAEKMKDRRPPDGPPPQTGQNGSNKNNGSGGGGPGPGGPGRNPQGMFENTDSTTRAQMHEYHERLHQRMHQ